MENEKYFKEILKRFDKQVKALKSAKTPNDVSTCEREIAPIMNELLNLFKKALAKRCSH